MLPEQKIQESINKYNLEENIVPISLSKLKLLDKMRIYRFNKEDDFLIENANIGETKTQFNMNFGIIRNSTFKMFRGVNGLFNNINFINVTHQNTKFNKVIYANCTFREIEFLDSEINDTQFINCVFDKCDISTTIFNNVIFYHCIHDDLNIDKTCKKNNITFLELNDGLSSEVDNINNVKTTAITEPNEVKTPKDIKEYVTQPIISDETYQFKIITLKTFVGLENVTNTIFSDCLFDFNQPLSKIRFNGCEFINCQFPKESFMKTQLNSCSLYNCQFSNSLQGVDFNSCKLEQITIPENGFIKCNFNNCEFDEKEKYVRNMEDKCEVFPKTEEDQKVKEEKTLISGYKAILLATMKELKKSDDNPNDKQLIDDIAKLINSLGKKNNFEDDYIEKVKNIAKKMDKDQLKELILFLQNALFERI